MTDLKKLCHDDPEFVTECYEDDIKAMRMSKNCCGVILHGGTWEDCRFGKDWKEPGPPAFEGD